MKFITQNIKCSSCENLIKNSLQDEFGKILIYANDETTKIVEVSTKKAEKFKNELNELGFKVVEMIDE